MGKKISVVLPVYNGESYIQRSIRSVTGQSYANWELVIVDDGSSDDTVSIAAELARQDARVKLICQKNQGVSIARNRGIEETTGDLIMFLDADDWFEQDAFQQVIHHWKDSAQLLLFDYYDVAEGGKKTLKRHFKAEEIVFDLAGPHTVDELILYASGFYKNELGKHASFMTCWVMAYEAFYLKENKLGFPQGIAMCEDQVFSLGVLMELRQANYISLPLYNYYLNYQSASTVSDKRTGQMLVSDIDYCIRYVDRIFQKKKSQEFVDAYYRYIFHRLKVLLWWLAEDHSDEERKYVRGYCEQRFHEVATHMDRGYSLPEWALITLCAHGGITIAELPVHIWKRLKRFMRKR